MIGPLVDFGLVRRAECHCGLVIVVGSTSSDATVAATVARHNETRQHRVYYETLSALYDQPETPPLILAPGLSDERRTDLTSRGATPSEAVRDGRVTSPRSRGGVSISPDGYDFRLDDSEVTK